MVKIEYRGFNIEACPQKLKDGLWTIGVRVERTHPDMHSAYFETRERLMNSPEHAARESYRYGKALIDARHPDLDPPRPAA